MSTHGYHQAWLWSQQNQIMPNLPAPTGDSWVVGQYGCFVWNGRRMVCRDIVPTEAEAQAFVDRMTAQGKRAEWSLVGSASEAGIQCKCREIRAEDRDLLGWHHRMDCPMYQPMDV
jgi:hypothetical protein